MEFRAVARVCVSVCVCVFVCVGGLLLQLRGFSYVRVVVPLSHTAGTK